MCQVCRLPVHSSTPRDELGADAADVSGEHDPAPVVPVDDGAGERGRPACRGPARARRTGRTGERAGVEVDPQRDGELGQRRADDGDELSGRDGGEPAHARLRTGPRRRIRGGPGSRRCARRPCPNRRGRQRPGGSGSGWRRPRATRWTVRYGPARRCRRRRGRVGAGDDLGEFLGPVLQEEVPGLVQHDQGGGVGQEVPLAVALLVELGGRVAVADHGDDRRAQRFDRPASKSPVKYVLGLPRALAAVVDHHASWSRSRSSTSTPGGLQRVGLDLVAAEAVGQVRRARSSSRRRAGRTGRCRRGRPPRPGGPPPPAGGRSRRSARRRARSARTARAGPSIPSRISSTQPCATSSTGRVSSSGRSSWPGMATEYSAQPAGSASASGW